MTIMVLFPWAFVNNLQSFTFNQRYVLYRNLKAQQASIICSKDSFTIAYQNGNLGQINDFW